MRTPPGDALLLAIPDPFRRRVLDLLVRSGEARASSLAEKVPFSRQAVSTHLMALEGGLVSRRKQGREVLYHVDAERPDQGTPTMVQLAKRWEGPPSMIQRLAEAAHSQATAKKGSLP